MLQCIGIFRIFPDVVGVGLIEDPRERGKLQQIRKYCYHVRVPEDASVVAFRVFLDELAAVVFQASENLSVSYPVWSLDEVLYVSGVGPEGGLESLRLVGLDVIGPEFNS